MKKIWDAADESVREWCWEPEDFDSDPSNWGDEMWVVWSKSVIKNEIRIAEKYLYGCHEHLAYTIKSHRLHVGPEAAMQWIMDALEEFKKGETYWGYMKLEHATDGIVELIMDYDDSNLPADYEDGYERCNETLDQHTHYCNTVMAMRTDWEQMVESELVAEYFENDHIVQIACAMADGRINDTRKMMAHFYYEKRISFRYVADEYYTLESDSHRKGNLMKVTKQK